MPVRLSLSAAVIAATLQFAAGGAVPAAAASAAQPFCGMTVAAGSFHSLAVKADGTVWAWGNDSRYSLGDTTAATPPDQNAPVKVLGPGATGQLSGAIAVAAGGYTSMALMTNGTVWAWGDNGYGQVGDNKVADPTKSPVQVHGPGNVGFLTDVVAISEGRYHSLALKSDGTVWSWGRNDNGQLGNNAAPTESDTPVQVHGVGDSGFLGGAIAISAGNYFSAALRSDGTVVAWGQNDNGQLGDNTITERDTPVQVHGTGDAGFLTNIKAIAANRHQVTTLRNDGTMWSWGSNTDGELGDGTQTERHTPVQVHGVADSGFLTGVAAIGMAGHHGMAIKADGTFYDWGRNSNGQLGDNKAANPEKTPVQVFGIGGTGFLTGGEAIVGGDHFSLAVRSDGSLAAWGQGNDGELGDGGGVERDTPVKVDQTSGLTAVPGPCLQVGAVSPASASCTGGAQVTITGSGYEGATQVTFGSTPATAFSVSSDVSLTATSPPGSAGRVDIRVTTPRGTSAAVAADGFSCVAAAVTPTLPKAGAGGTRPGPAGVGVALLVLAAVLAAGGAGRRLYRAQA
jgi:alpha-tubulin suppressor-like RCC1 family protein